MLTLKSSNPYKISEFTRLLKGHPISVEAGSDIKEVLADKDTVIVQKALSAGEEVLVEDTVLIIDGKEEVEIRWKWEDLQTGSLVTWIISIGILKDNKVSVYRGTLETIVDRSFGNDGVAFEPFLVPLIFNPNKINYTLLAQEIDKDLIDPRAMAVENLLNDNPAFVQDVSNIPAWNGAYQND